MHDEGDDELRIAPCPSCGRSIYAEAERCPRCGEYVAGGAKRKPVWIWIGIVLALAVLVMWALRG